MRLTSRSELGPPYNTLILSFQDKFSRNFVGLLNYQYFFTTSDTLIALRNNAIWLVLLTLFAVGGGLIVAILFDRVRYEWSAAEQLQILARNPLRSAAGGHQRQHR